MNKIIFKYIQQYYSSDPLSVDRLIVSSFLKYNNIKVETNLFIKNYIITEDTAEREALEFVIDILIKENKVYDFEYLIELFEFVVSPSEKIINGAIYTPKNIREYIVNQTFAQGNFQVNTLKTADISCGCGGFLLSLTEKIKQLSGRSFRDIFAENIYGIDIAEYSINRAKILLSLYAITNGEDIDQFDFNLYTNNSLTFNWNENCAEINLNGGFDIIVGNPPYVCSRNMDNTTLELLKNIEVAKTGHPDLYIPFFQIGLENLNENGILGYITVNTFTKSINGRALREYFANNDINLKIINFGGEQVFKSRNTYTCICFLRKGNGHIGYTRTESKYLSHINLNTLLRFEYASLSNKDGWNLSKDIDTDIFIKTIEKIGKPFKDLYNTKNGIATLKNDVYKFKPTKEDDQFYYFSNKRGSFQVEKKICRDIINANKLKSEKDIDLLREKIIFPYDGSTRILPEDIMRKEFPFALSYLQSQKKLLATRDKSKREYEQWYAYGRRQSMDINSYKLFFPHICDRPSFVICREKELLFYNGIAIISNSLEELVIIKKIMESDIFFKYITNVTKDYSSGYISMSRNYLKNFGVYQFTEDQKKLFLKTNKINDYLEDLYFTYELTQ